MTTKVAQLMHIIKERPGIRSVELAEITDIDTELVTPLLGSRIKSGEVRAEKVLALSGRQVNSYYIGNGQAVQTDASGSPAQGKDFAGVDIDKPIQRTTPWPAPAPKSAPVKSATQKRVKTEDRGPDSMSIGVFSSGELVISVRGRGVRLKAAETLGLIAFLDRLNIEQIIAEA